MQGIEISLSAIETFATLGIIALILFGLCVFFVKKQTVAIVERLGKFHRIKNSGIHLKIPFVEQIADRILLETQQFDIVVDAKTKEDIVVKLKISTHYLVMKEKVYDAFYRLNNPQEQMTSYIFKRVRTEIKMLKLNDVFKKKDDIADAITFDLRGVMNGYGYDIIKISVKDIRSNRW